MEDTITMSAIAVVRVLAPGLVEFRTSHLQDEIQSHEIVKALVVALKNYVVESGGEFRTISVTPEGLTVTAESSAGD